MSVGLKNVILDDEPLEKIDCFKYFEPLEKIDCFKYFEPLEKIDCFKYFEPLEKYLKDGP